MTTVQVTVIDYIACVTKFTHPGQSFESMTVWCTHLSYWRVKLGLFFVVGQWFMTKTLQKLNTGRKKERNSVVKRKTLELKKLANSKHFLKKIYEESFWHWSLKTVYKVEVQLHSKLINLSVGTLCKVQVGLQWYRSVFMQTCEWNGWMEEDQLKIGCWLVSCLYWTPKGLL